MPSTDIDGRIIVILSEEEALVIYNDLQYLQEIEPLTDVEQRVVNKIASDLNLSNEVSNDSTEPT